VRELAPGGEVGVCIPAGSEIPKGGISFPSCHFLLLLSFLLLDFHAPTAIAKGHGGAKWRL